MLEFYEFWLDLAAIVIGIFLQRKGKKNQNKSMLVVGKTLIVLGAILAVVFIVMLVIAGFVVGDRAIFVRTSF